MAIRVIKITIIATAINGYTYLNCHRSYSSTNFIITKSLISYKSHNRATKTWEATMDTWLR